MTYCNPQKAWWRFEICPFGAQMLCHMGRRGHGTPPKPKLGILIGPRNTLVYNKIKNKKFIILYMFLFDSLFYFFRMPLKFPWTPNAKHEPFCAVGGLIDDRPFQPKQNAFQKTKVMGSTSILIPLCRSKQFNSHLFVNDQAKECNGANKDA